MQFILQEMMIRFTFFVFLGKYKSIKIKIICLYKYLPFLYAVLQIFKCTLKSNTGVLSLKHYTQAKNYPSGYESNHQKQNQEGKRVEYCLFKLIV